MLRHPWVSTKVLMVAACLSACGCADLKAVRDFAATSATIANGNPSVDELGATFDRRKTTARDLFAMQQRWDPGNPPNQADLDARLQALGAERKAADETVANVRALEKAVVAYMTVLGQLADDELASYDKDVGKLTDALVAKGDLSDEHAKAAKSLASIVARAATDAWRQRELGTLIERSDGDLQVVMNGYRATLVRGVEGALGDEQQAVENYYRQVVQRAPAGDATVVALLLRARSEGRRGDRRATAAAADYVKALDTVARGHAELKKNVRRLSDRELLARIKGYAADIETVRQNIAALRKG